MRTFLSILAFSSITWAQAGFDAVRDFQKAIIDEEITGSNVAMVYQDGKTLYFHSENSGKPGDKGVTPSTIFPIWSMTKPITIVAMMTLHEKGLVNFDDPVSKYIPEFADLKCKGEDGVYDCENELTVYHLMTHRSGYQYYSTPSNRGLTSTVRFDNLEDFAKAVADQPVEFEPGTQYMYGINQAILGRIVEVISGQTFYEYLKETIFDPLGMNDTKFYLTHQERLTRFQPLFINSGNLKGFTDALDELTYDEGNHAYFGGEGLVSTMMDYSKFCRMLLNGSTFEGKHILSHKSINLMTEKHSEGWPLEEHGYELQLGMYYGFSLFVLGDSEADDTGSPAGIYGWDGYHNTHFWIDPENDLFALFMTRAREFNWPIQKRFREAVYSSVE